DNMGTSRTFQKFFPDFKKQLEYTRFPRAANEPPRGLWDWDCALLVPSKSIAITRPTENISSHWSLAYSCCWDGFSFSTSCFTIPIHLTIIYIYMILSFVNSKRYLVDWNGRRRLPRE